MARIEPSANPNKRYTLHKLSDSNSVEEIRLRRIVCLEGRASWWAQPMPRIQQRILGVHQLLVMYHCKPSWMLALLQTNVLGYHLVGVAGDYLRA